MEIFKIFPGEYAPGPPYSFSCFSISLEFVLPEKIRLKILGNYAPPPFKISHYATDHEQNSSSRTKRIVTNKTARHEQNGSSRTKRLITNKRDRHKQNGSSQTKRIVTIMERPLSRRSTTKISLLQIIDHLRQT